MSRSDSEMDCGVGTPESIAAKAIYQSSADTLDVLSGINGAAGNDAFAALPILLASEGQPRRARHLKEATSKTHDRLDHSIMAHKPFESRQRYGLFVTVQHQFHREIDALYTNATLDTLLPDLAGRRRLPLIEDDLADLGLTVPVSNAALAFADSANVDLPIALGWLYVAEGSNLGAAFLLKDAMKLGLSETFAARHLAAAPEGRGLHWKTFTAALDGVNLNKAEEERVVAGAQAAFARVRALVKEVFAG